MQAGNRNGFRCPVGKNYIVRSLRHNVKITGVALAQLLKRLPISYGKHRLGLVPVFPKRLVVDNPGAGIAFETSAEL